MYSDNVVALLRVAPFDTREHRLDDLAKLLLQPPILGNLLEMQDDCTPLADRLFHDPLDGKVAQPPHHGDAAEVARSLAIERNLV